MVDRDDAFHESCIQTARTLRDPVYTVWPVLTEAMHLVGPIRGDEGLWDLLDRMHLRFLALDAADLPPIRALMKKYADLPMDLADAALVHVAAREAIRTVFTIDRTDFGLYRLPGGRRLRLLP
jgi:hypothetical protein